jgi:hypothetical protein
MFARVVEFISFYIFSELVPYVTLLVTLRYALGRCNNTYYVGFTECGRAVCYLLVSLVWSALPWHCLSRNCCAGLRSMDVVCHVRVVVQVSRASCRSTERRNVKSHNNIKHTTVQLLYTLKGTF